MMAPCEYLRHNILSVLKVVEAAVTDGCPPIVIFSTANLYAETGEVAIDESHPIDPGSPYGESKHVAERALYWAEKAHGLHSARLRYFNAAGADPEAARGEGHKSETHLIPRVQQVALGQRSHIEIYGADYPTPDGSCIRDYVHVEDLAAAHVRALEALLQGSSSMCYNVGSGIGYSVRQVVAAARRVTGHPILVVEAPRRLGDPARLVASSARLERELGWRRAFADLGAIVETAWNWHRNQSDGFRRRCAAGEYDRPNAQPHRGFAKGPLANEPERNDA